MSTWNSRANEVFLQALELRAPDERDAYLRAACDGDPSLHEEVESLLMARDQAGSFLERPINAAQLAATLERPIAEQPGTAIGPYKLLEQIGEGGFGVVFMAEQQQPLRRKVALKVLKPGMDSRQIVARFEAERLYQETIALLREQAKTNYWLAECYEALAQIGDAQGRAAAALDARRKATAAWEQLANDATRSPDRRASSFARMAELSLRTNDPAAARDGCQKALALCAKAVAEAPGSAYAHHTLAWLHVTCPIAELREPVKAIALAKKAVELALTEGAVWNTLGVAHYRAGEWSAAVETLTQAMALRDGGDARDWLFLAMAHWQLGEKELARKWYDRAAGRMEKHQPSDDELERFRAEADELLGLAALTGSPTGP